MKAYTIEDVRQAQCTLEPITCAACGSREVVYLQYVDGGIGVCQDCGEIL